MKGKIGKLRFMSLLQAVFITITLLVLLLGLFSINYTQIIAGKTKTLYDRPHTNLVSMWNVKAKVSETGSLIKESILTKTISTNIASNFTEISNLLEQIEANKVDPKAPRSETMEAVLKALAAWMEKGSQVLDSLEQTASVSAEDVETYSTAESELLLSVDAIITTASQNALKFRNSTVSMANQVMIVMIFIFLVVVIYITVFIKILMKRFKHPMMLVQSAAEDIATGNLHTEIEYDNNDEFGELTASFQRMKNNLSSIVDNIDAALEAIGQGDFNVKADASYIGDFLPISNSLNKITDNLTMTLKEINDASEKVLEGAGQMNSGAQSLSEGAANEAESVEKLASAINRISVQISDTSENAGDANQKVIRISEEIIKNNEQMNEMMQSMENISDKSKQIANIIHVIEDIASQTNLLSLNASIEAARAGEQGKGFAVVANEVKALAEQSAAAAKDSAQLIIGSLKAVEEGTEIAKRTADNLLLFAEETKEITSSVENISKASEDQTHAVNQISYGIDQVVNVIKDTSSTADDTAAHSNDLASQAEALKALVSKFRLKEN